MQPQPNQLLGDFRLIRKIGQGAMGVVFEAEQLSLRRRVALKVLSPSLAGSDEAQRRFHTEMLAASRLHHTNIVSVLTSGQHEQTFYYVMVLVEGASLAEILRTMHAMSNGEVLTSTGSILTTVVPTSTQTQTVVVTKTPHLPTPPRTDQVIGDIVTLLTQGENYFDRVAELVANVGSALHYAHQHGVVHRDIKPGNLILSRDGHISVTDFGLAQVADVPGVTVAGQLLGSPAYMSPEQCQGKAIDHRSDIYSLGVTLYQLLTLSLPFTNEQYQLVASRMPLGEPPLPRSIRAEIPLDLETVCLKALETDPADRYQTAAEMVDDLLRFIKRYAIAAKRASVLERMRKFVKRHKIASSIVTAAMLVVLVTIGYSYFQLQRANDLRLQDIEQQALLASAAGDFEQAEKAIEQAEALGASHAWIRMLRGQLAFHQGQSSLAMKELEQACRLAPLAVAPKAMLAVVFYDHGEWDKYYVLLEELERREAVTYEDFLFKGLAQSLSLPQRGLEALQTAVAKRSANSLARLSLAKALTEQAMDTAQVSDIESALEQARTVKELLKNNASALSIHLVAELVAANIYREKNNIQRLAEALAGAERDANILSRKEYASLVEVQWALGHYYETTNRPDQALIHWQAAATANDAPSAAVAFYANALYRQGKVKEGEDFLRPLVEQNRDVTVDISWSMLLSENQFSSTSAREAAQKALARKTSGLVAIYPQTILRLLGDKAGAEQATQELQDRFKRMPAWMLTWYQHLLNYNLGALSADELIQHAGSSRRNLCEAHFFIGITALADGNREQAARHFEKSIETGVFLWLDLDYSRSYLAQLKARPDWPRWRITTNIDN